MGDLTTNVFPRKESVKVAGDLRAKTNRPPLASGKDLANARSLACLSPPEVPRWNTVPERTTEGKMKQDL